jgi:hypothetical protein
VRFDGATERFVGDEAADKLLGRTYRAPYSLPTIRESSPDERVKR